MRASCAASCGVAHRCWRSENAHLECGGRTATLGGVLQSPELLSTDLTEGLQRITTLPLIIDQRKREFFSKLLLRDVLFEILLEDAMQRLICGSNNRIGRR